MITTLDVSIPAQLMTALVPDLVLMGGAMVLLLWAAWQPDSQEHQRRVGLASIVLAGITILITLQWSGRYDAGPGPIALDDFRWFVDVVILLGTIGAIALSMDDNMRSGIKTAEAHVLILLASSGMMLLAAARDLMIVFLGIELMSISVYALAGINRRSERSAEGALKYFLLGAFSTAFLLYGIALVYGATGTTNLTLIGGRVAVFHLANSPLLLIGIGMMVIGFGFKVATVPFHMWAPDVYEGAPTPITAYMAAAVKAAAFAGFLRVWLEAFSGVTSSWHGPVWWLAVVTMIVGNLVALAQKDIKRMLAYSSIAHAGYILVAVASATSAATSAFMFYLLAYTLATFGAFGVISSLERNGGTRLAIEDYAGLWSVKPWLASAMAVFMLALLGFPIFGGMGFFAKYWIIQSALQAPVPQTKLAVILVIASVISAGYYLYVVMVMFMRPRPDNAPTVASSSGWTRSVIAAAAILILVLGILPNSVIRWTEKSSNSVPVAVR